MEKNKVINILNKTTEWSLYILVFSVPFSKTMLELCIAVSFFSWALKKYITKDYTISKTPINITLIAFFIVCSISVINADLKILAIRYLVSKYLKYMALYFVVVDTINTKARLKRVLGVAFISAAIVMCDAYIQHFVLHKDIFRSYPSFKYNPGLSPGFLGFPTGPFPFPNDLAAWMLMVLIPVAVFFFWAPGKARIKIILGSLLFPFTYLFYLTNVRGAWLGFLASFFTILIIKRKKKIILILLLAGLTALPFLPKKKVGDILGFSSMQDRFYMWRIGCKVFAEHPVVGGGPNTFFSRFKELREDEYRGRLGSYAHNGYLQLAAETGVVGLGLFLLLIGKALHSSLKGINARSLPYGGAFILGLTGGLLAFLIHSFFDTNLQSLPLACLFWFSLALLMGSQKIYDG